MEWEKTSQVCIGESGNIHLISSGERELERHTLSLTQQDKNRDKTEKFVNVVVNLGGRVRIV